MGKLIRIGMRPRVPAIGAIGAIGATLLSIKVPDAKAFRKRKPPMLAAVALANKTARIAWKLMVSGERYEPRLNQAIIAPCSAPSRPLRAADRGGLRPALTAAACNVSG